MESIGFPRSGRRILKKKKRKSPSAVYNRYGFRLLDRLRPNQRASFRPYRGNSRNIGYDLAGELKSKRASNLCVIYDERRVRI